MATITHRGNPVHTNGELPAVGTMAPDFRLVASDLTVVDQSHFRGTALVLNIFPSVDTSVCATSVREFNKRAAEWPGVKILCISKDLPFAHRRFCGAEGIANVISLSDFRDPDFANRYGVTMLDGSLAGLMARAVVVLDGAGKVVYTELVPSIGQQPDYDRALNALPTG
jgi:thiol peroxidase